MPLGLLNNQLIKDLRNSLLGRNLNPTAEANLGGVGSSNTDRGLPAEVNIPGTDYIPFNQETVSSLGNYQLKNLSLKNRYAPFTFEQINLSDNLALAGNIGIYTDYSRTVIPPNFNAKQYVLNSPTISNYNDTPLGVIGLEQLRFSLQANIAQNTIKNTIGRINTNLFSLLNGEEFLIRDYQISQFPNNLLGFFANLTQKYSGIEIPIDIIPRSSFGFLDELFNGKVNYANCNLEDLDDSTRMGMLGGVYRNDALLRYTGRGNRVQLFNMLGINKYRPDYNSQNGGGALNRIFGVLQQQKDNEAAAYTTLEKTRRSTGTLPVMKNLGIADPAPPGRYDLLGKRGVTGAFIENDARSVLRENGLPKITWDNKDKPNDFKKFMFSIENLAWIGQTDGLPDCEIGNGDMSSNDKRPGRIMWFPPYDLTFNENVSVQWEKTNFIGRGEPIFTYNNTTRSGTIKFKVIVDHPSIINKLRETFTDSDFKKFFKGCNTDKDYVKTAIDFLSEQKQKGKVTEENRTVIENKIIKETETNFKKVYEGRNLPGGTESFSTKIFFPNASSVVDPNYETPTQTNGATPVDPNLNINTQNYINNTNFNLNATSFDTYAGFQSPETTSKLNDINNNESTIEKIEVSITVSNTNIGGSQVNNTLGQNRINSATDWVRQQLSKIPSSKISIIKNSPVVTNIGTSTNSASATEKEGRFALIEFVVTKKSLIENSQSGITETNTFVNDIQDTVVDTIVRTYAPMYMECDYFYFLEKNEKFVYDSFKEKIKYFHPGFHSTTPEGLNSRLTFLHQCTRQGPAINQEGTRSNLAFSRPPICILRIGDFFHTKMVIESMNIDYDEGVLWDLNPEGIGVQPRLATISLTVSYLGGQSLYTPIRELQNALGFNFYANTETFQHAPLVREERIVPISRERTITNQKKTTSIDLTTTETTQSPFVDSPIQSNNNFNNLSVIDYNSA